LRSAPGLELGGGGGPWRAEAELSVRSRDGRCTRIGGLCHPRGDRLVSSVFGFWSGRAVAVETAWPFSTSLYALGFPVRDDQLLQGESLSAASSPRFDRRDLSRCPSVGELFLRGVVAEVGRSREPEITNAAIGYPPGSAKKWSWMWEHPFLVLHPGPQRRHPPTAAPELFLCSVVAEGAQILGPHRRHPHKAVSPSRPHRVPQRRHGAFFDWTQTPGGRAITGTEQDRAKLVERGK